MITSFEYLNLNPDKPVIFLDIDGVLNGGWQHEHLPNGLFPVLNVGMGDYVLVEKLNALKRISRRQGAQWVIVSSWLKGHLPETAKDVVYLKGEFDYSNIKGSLQTTGGPERGLCVWRCIEALGLINYVVVDDAKEQMYAEVVDRLGERFIHANGRYGLQDPDFAEIQRLIGG